MNEEMINKVAQKLLEYDFDRHGVKYGVVAREILSLETDTHRIAVIPKVSRPKPHLGVADLCEGNE